MNHMPHNSSDGASIMLNLMMRCRSKAMTILELFQVTDSLQQSGLYAHAVDVYKNWIAYNSDNPHVHMANFNYSIALQKTGDHAAAILALQNCIMSNTDFAQAYINLGRAYEDMGLIDEAVRQWQIYAQQSHVITPERAAHRLMALQHTGRVLENHERLQEAEDVIWEAMELRPDKKEAGQHWLSIRQRQCKWPIFQTSQYVTERDMIDALSPMTLACYADDPIFQMAKAYRYSRSLVGKPVPQPQQKAAVRSKLKTGKKIRVGYLSSDLREHAVGFALSELVEHHDKTKFEFYAYYCGDRKQNDPVQNRIKHMMDEWTDINAMSDEEAAAKILSDEIDILLDVNGFTKNARFKIFSYRPAPVIASFCGYPGTLASPYHQYLIADDYIIPPDYERFYTEKVLRITCNQPVDRKRPIGLKANRATYRLPSNAVVYACFNGMQKITEQCFKRWMDILKAVPNAVLWLLEGSNNVDQRLVGLAMEHGVAAHRLIFAGKVANPDHLARIELADIFLDTFPYGAHSTGSDAINMGLPVITFAGNSFASRFCASIVNAAGMPQLIANSPEQYVATAIRLGSNPAELKALREELQAKLETSTLRDIPALTKSLETCIVTMQTAAESGDLPKPDFRNMDLYYELGTEVISEGFEHLSLEEYTARYRKKLERLSETEVVSSDMRLRHAS